MNGFNGKPILIPWEYRFLTFLFCRCRCWNGVEVVVGNPDANLFYMVLIIVNRSAIFFIWGGIGYGIIAMPMDCLFKQFVEFCPRCWLLNILIDAEHLTSDDSAVNHIISTNGCNRRSFIKLVCQTLY